VVNDRHVNAVALPGGPVYVNTGLLAVLDNETQLAGVLAHEMSHVALRHGTHQATKAIFVQAPAAAAEALIREDTNLADLARLGITFTANSVLLNYSRENEHEADLNGALMMNDVGYDPIEMARFFEKLERQGEGGGVIASWFSDHPAPANRVRDVEHEVRLLPRTHYTESEPRTLARVKRIVSGLPRPPRSGD
jgi:predicted Zn-dependent protease